MAYATPDKVRDVDMKACSKPRSPCVQTNPDVNPGSATSPRIVTGGLSYGNIPSALDTPAHVKRVALKMDPALLTCFDPADKELYDLWAPQQR